MNIIQKIKRKPLLSAQIIFTALAFLWMAILSYYYAISIVNNNLTRYTESVFNFAQTQIESDLASSEMLLGGFAQSVRNMLLRGDDMSALQDYFTDMSGYLSECTVGGGVISSLYGEFDSPCGGSVVLYSTADSRQGEPRPRRQFWFRCAMEADGEVIETMPYRNRLSGDVIVTYARCIFNENGKSLGIVCLDIQVAEIGREIVEIALEQGGYAMLLDQKMDIIAHVDSDYVGLNLRNSGLPISIFADEIFAGKCVSQRSFINWTGEDTAVFMRQLSNGWYLGVLTPSTPFYKSISSMFILLCLIGALLAATLIWILVGIDARRIKADDESRQKSVFLANMSHEIRTPMNAIIGMTAIGKSAGDSERKNYCLLKIEDASNHLLGVINDILDMSKIEANKFELAHREFKFDKMLQGAVNVVTFRVDEKKQKFTLNIDEDIPKTLIGDDQRLVQVITNLLGNAVKFTPEGGEIDLSARLLEQGDDECTIKISVTDTGIGISREQQAGLFRPFQQAESSTTRQYGGTGLGLSISKSIVEMMGGAIWVESEPGQGSVFAFKVRLRQVSRRDAANEGLDAGETHKEERPHNLTGLFEGKHILLAEDIEINREIVLTLLENTRLQIDCAENGEGAVNMFSEAPEKYDMIFMDVQMPKMDGYEATRRIRAMNAPRAKTIPIIALTANVFREDVEKCLKAGMSGHMGKPLDYEEVAGTLRTYLSH